MTRDDDTPIADYARMLRLDDRRYVILGAGQGIGRQACHALAARCVGLAGPNGGGGGHEMLLVWRIDARGRPTSIPPGVYLGNRCLAREAVLPGLAAGGEQLDLSLIHI